MDTPAGLFSNKRTLLAAIDRALNSGGCRVAEVQQYTVVNLIMDRAMDLFLKGYLECHPDKSRISITILQDTMCVNNQYTADLFNFEHPDYRPNWLGPTENKTIVWDTEK